MATYVQADRPLTVTTPLGEDVLLLVGFTGQEGISQLFSFQLDLLAVNGTEVAFDKLLGRNMEEEGIFYFFKQTADGHKMVVANTPQSHSDLAAGSKIIYEELEGGTRDEDRVYGWRKIQELRSGKYTLWDHCFELPGKNLE